MPKKSKRNKSVESRSKCLPAESFHQGTLLNRLVLTISHIPKVGGLRFTLEKAHAHQAGDLMVTLDKHDPANAGEGAENDRQLFGRPFGRNIPCSCDCLRNRTPAVGTHSFVGGACTRKMGPVCQVLGNTGPHLTNASIWSRLSTLSFVLVARVTCSFRED